MVTTSRHTAPGNARPKVPGDTNSSGRQEPGRIIFEFRASPGYVPAAPGLADPDDIAVDEHISTDLVVIAASHPTLGYLYRRHVDESRSNSPDEYALTTDVATATPLPREWRNYPGLQTRMGDRFLQRMLSCSGSTDDRMYGHLETIRQLSQQDARAFFCWFDTAEWIDLPAPAGMCLPVATS